MYLPWWAIILLGLAIAVMAYEAGTDRVRTQWHKSEKERRERRRVRKEQKHEAGARQRIRAQYGDDLDDEAVDMIAWLEEDGGLSEESKALAIAVELSEDRKRKGAGEPKAK